MLKQLVDKYPNLRKKILKPFIFLGYGPDTVTVLTLFWAMFAGYFFYLGEYLIAAFFLFLNGFFDILDGEIAKVKKIQTKRGDFLDHTFDRVSDVIIFIGIAYNPTVPMDVAFITLSVLLVVSYLGTQAQALTDKRLYGGIVGRSDRHAIIFLGAVLDYVYAGAFVYAMYLVLVLSLVTFFQRFRTIYKELDD